MRGFSLVEILVTLFIFSLIFAALFVLLSGGQTSWYTGDAQIELNQQLRKALMTINRELRQSRSSVISDVPADDNYYTSITFKLPEDVDGDGDVIDSFGNIEWSEDINYARNANNQIVRLMDLNSSILANNISSLQFRRFSGNPDVIQIYIATQKTTLQGRTLGANIMSSVKMRN